MGIQGGIFQKAKNFGPLTVRRRQIVTMRYIPQLCRALTACLGLMIPALTAAGAGIPSMGLEMWLDASAIAGLTNGARVAAWSDLTTNDHHATQAIATNQPAYATNAIGGQPGVLWDGADRLNIAGKPLNFTVFEIFFVIRTPPGPDDGIQRYVLGGYGGGSKAMSFDCRPAYYFSPYDRDANNVVLQKNIVTTFNTDYIANFIHDAPSQTHFSKKNTDAALGSSSKAAYLTNTAFDTTGYLGYTANAWNSYISELIIYRRKLADAERVLVENNLSAKYAITLNASNKKYTGDETAKGNYDRDVFGIGQAAAGAPATNGSAAGLILDADGTLDAGDYLLAGNKTITNSIVTTDLTPNSAAKSRWRWSRVWYLEKTGDLDARLTFDWTAGGVPGDFKAGAIYWLLYSSSDPFVFSVVPASCTVAGDRVTFTVANGNLANGYYTLGIPPPRGTICKGF